VANVAAFGGEDIEKYLWIEREKIFSLKIVRQRIISENLRKIPFGSV
jgi:hypothetical protein